MEWIETWMPLLTILVAPAGLLVVLVQRWKGNSKTKDITPVEESKAFASAEAESGLNREGLEFAHDALRQAREAMKETQQMSQRLSKAESYISTLAKELEKFKYSNVFLWNWIHNVRNNWPTLRLKEEAPEAPEDFHHP